MTRITDIDAFVARAKALGAEVEENPAFKPDPEFRIWASPSNGGCGSDGCRCSPGLWIAASQGSRHAIAHFGSDWERGGDGYFDDHDIDAFRKLRKETGA